MKLTALLLLLVSGAAFAASEEQINKTFQVASGGKLIVDVDFGSIDVSTNAAPGEVAVDVWRKVTRSGKNDEEQYLRDNPVQFLRDGNTLTVRCRTKEKTRGFMFNVGKNRNEGKYTIRVPAQFSAKLNTSGGGIAVSDLTGDVNADTSGGGLRFARLHGPLNGGTSGGGIQAADCEGTLKIHTSGGAILVTGGSGTLAGDTSGGSVEVKGFRGNTRVRTSGGGITVENAVGQLEASTSGGSISATLALPAVEAVTLSTSGGGVTVRVAKNAAFELDAETSGGGVSSDLPVTVVGKMERDRLKGTVNGGGSSVRLRSSGGSIRVKAL